MLDLKNVAQHDEAVVARLKSRGGALDLGPFQKSVAFPAVLHPYLGGLRELKPPAVSPA